HEADVFPLHAAALQEQDGQIPGRQVRMESLEKRPRVLRKPPKQGGVFEALEKFPHEDLLPAHASLIGALAAESNVLERLLASQQIGPRLKVNVQMPPVVVVVHGLGHSHINAAERIDERAKPAVIDRKEI